MRGVGAPFTLRGVEAEVIGSLSGSKQAPILAIERTGETLRLARLTKKVQWDADGKRAAPAKRSERRAYDRLLSAWDGSPMRIRIVGPLRQDADLPRDARAASAMRLEVRQFRVVH